MKQQSFTPGIVVRTVAVVATVVFLAAGCALFPPDPNKPPRWAEDGSGAYVEDDRPVLVGVGLGESDPGKPGTPADRADQAARDALSRVTEIFILRVAHEYAVAILGKPDPSRQDPEVSRVELMLQSAVQVRFPGGRVEERWASPNDGRAYSLCRLDLEKLVDAALADDRLDESLRIFIQTRAGAIHQAVGEFVRENPVLIKDVQETDL